MPVVLLVRHAHAGSRSDWDGDDRDRPLTAKGWRQARQLASSLQVFAPARIVSSPYRRCVQTLQPLAELTGLAVEEDEVLAEGNGWPALAMVRAVAKDERAAVTALCTHGDVIPEILVALADEDHLDLGAAPRQEKGSTWVLEASAGTFERARYLPPGS